MLQEGLEPPTLGLLDPCSTKLSYQSYAAHARDRTKDLQIFSLTLSQLSYMGEHRLNPWPVGPGRWGDFQIETNWTGERKTKNNGLLRLPGIEPGSNAWEASMMTITLQALDTPGGDRTRDPRLIRPVLCL